LLPNQKIKIFADNLSWMYPTRNPSRQRPIALLELQLFFVDGSFVCEPPLRRLTAGIHSKVDIFPFYLMSVIQN